MSAVAKVLRAVGARPSAQEQVNRLREQTAALETETAALEKVRDEAHAALKLAVTDGAATGVHEKTIVEADAALARLAVRSGALQTASREAAVRLVAEQAEERRVALVKEQLEEMALATRYDAEIGEDVVALSRALAARQRHEAAEENAALELVRLGEPPERRPKHVSALVEEAAVRARSEYKSWGFTPFVIHIYLPSGA